MDKEFYERKAKERKENERIRTQLLQELEKMSDREILRKQIEMLALNSQQRCTVSDLTYIKEATETIRRTHNYLVLTELCSKIIICAMGYKFIMNLCVFIKKFFRR